MKVPKSDVLFDLARYSNVNNVIVVFSFFCFQTYFSQKHTASCFPSGSDSKISEKTFQLQFFSKFKLNFPENKWFYLFHQSGKSKYSTRREIFEQQTWLVVFLTIESWQAETFQKVLFVLIYRSIFKYLFRSHYKLDFFHQGLNR